MIIGSGISGIFRNEILWYLVSGAKLFSYLLVVNFSEHSLCIFAVLYISYMYLVSVIVCGGWWCVMCFVWF